MARVRMMVLAASSVISAALAGACAPLDDPRAATSAALVREAVEAGGREDPSASYYLALAERELARARALGAVRDAEGARCWARRAEADADVARMLAIGAAVRASARRTLDDAASLARKLEESP